MSFSEFAKVAAKKTAKAVGNSVLSTGESNFRNLSNNKKLSEEDREKCRDMVNNCKNARESFNNMFDD